MKYSSKYFARLLCALAVVCCAALSAAANERDAVRDRDLSRVISAKAGGVNNVAGDVTFARAGATDWKRLTTADDLKSGDAVRTGADGRAEILLNPGSYLRLGPDTEFVFAETALDKLRLRLSSGAALVEVTGFSDLDVLVTVETPEGNVELLRSGLYRFNARRNGEVEVFVHSGRARIDTVLVKGGQVARVARGASEAVVAKFDKKQQRDALDLWSRERAKTLAAINEKLQRRSINTLLAHARFDDLLNGFSSHVGLWLYSPSYGCYTFLPFAYGWPSPYGFSYGFGYVGFNRFCLPCHSGLQRHWNNGLNPNNTGWYDPGQNTSPSVTKSTSSASEWKSPPPSSAPSVAPRSSGTERSIGGGGGSKKNN